MEKVPKLYTLTAIARELKVPSKWLLEQVEAGNVPAVQTGRSYLFSLVPTLQAVSKLAECRIKTASSMEARGDE